jgi:hypothetical protein
MKPFNSRITGNNKVGIVAEPLQAPIPNISMNIIIGSRRHPKKFNVPHSRQQKSDNHNPPGKPWHDKEFTYRQEIRDAGQRQRGHEVRPTSIAKVA